MKYKKFEKLLLSYKNLWDNLDELETIGIDLCSGEKKYDLMKDIEIMLYCALEISYKQKGVDWVSWFMFDDNFGEKSTHTIQSIWEQIKKYKK